jgi:transposase-like protein
LSLHLDSIKHKNNIINNKNNSSLAKKTYNCENCSKNFNDRAGLWRHKKTCSFNGVEQAKQPSVQSNHHVEKTDETTDKQLLMMLIKENSELRKEQSDIKELILEIVKNGTHNTTNNNTNNTNNTNSHNKAFNLNFFLNETCKNAMNITDFVDSIKLQLSDFMDVGEVGYIQGISNIIVKKLNALDETIRPIHCTDQKRETFYVKDENKWEKEEEDFNRIRKMIKKVAYKNERLMTSYKEKYPDYNDPESKRSDHYSKTVIEALGGDGDNYKEKENKIIKNISRATHPKGKN